MSTRRSSSSVSIELVVPQRHGSRGGIQILESFEQCCVCLNSFCSEEACCRAANPNDCCSFTSGNAVCCGCTVKMAARCRCNTECEAVVAPCPLCRSYNGVDALVLFLGSLPPCKDCSKEVEEGSDTLALDDSDSST